jgi:PAS domain S-box-containing protein
MEKDRKAPGELNAEKSNTEHQPHHFAFSLNAKHQQIINQHLPIAIVETSLDGEYLDVSQEFCRMLGYEREELARGRSFNTSLMPAAEKPIIPQIESRQPPSQDATVRRRSRAHDRGDWSVLYQRSVSGSRSRASCTSTRSCPESTWPSGVRACDSAR